MEGLYGMQDEIMLQKGYSTVLYDSEIGCVENGDFYLTGHVIGNHHVIMS